MWRGLGHQMQVVNGDSVYMSDEESVSRLTYGQAFQAMAKLGGPYTLGQLVNAGYVITNGIVIAKLGATAVAAGPLIGTLTYSVLGSFRGGVLATAVLVGEHNGAQEYPQIGRLLQHSWVLGTALCVPAAVILFNAGNIFIAMGTPHPVAEVTQNYFTALLYGILPFFWLTSDQQFALGIKQPTVAMVSGAAFRLLSMAIGFPLALYTPLRLQGLGYGISIAAWATHIGTRLYFLSRTDYAKFGIFLYQCKGLLQNIKRLLKLGLPMGLQTLSEWGNLLAISIMMGRFGETVLAAEQGALQPIIMINLLLFAFVQATSVAVSNALGQARKFDAQGLYVLAGTAQKNARCLGNAGMMISCLAATLSAVPLIIWRGPIASLSLDRQAVNYQESLSMAQPMLISNALGLPADSVRVSSAGALRGYKDAVFAPSWSFLTMSVIGLVVGALLTLVYGWDANWLLITRAVGILLAAIGIVYRWQNMPVASELQSGSEIVEADLLAIDGIDMQRQVLTDVGMNMQLEQESSDTRCSLWSSCCAFWQPSRAQDSEFATQEYIAIPQFAGSGSDSEVSLRS